MEKRSILSRILLKLHYRTVLALITVGLGVLTFSGVYFFGDHIVNVADQEQKISRIQLPQSRSEENIDPEETIESSTPTPTPTTTEPHIGGGKDLPTVTPAPTITGATVSPTPTATISATPVVTRFAASELTQGVASAPVTLSVWTDFACEFCSNFTNQTLPQLVSDYVSQGKLKIIFHNFPLVSHSNSPVVHQAAMCSADQSSFWKSHDKLFASQTSWASQSESDLKSTLSAYAKDLGLKTDLFITCLDTNKYASFVDEDKAAGQGLGINGAPTFFVNSQKIDGAQPYSVFKAAIDAELAK